MSDASNPTPDKNGMPFVDPWVKEAKHQREIPVDAVFVGAWHSYLGIDHLCEALFLARDDRQDLLWSLTTHSHEATKQNLVAREGRDPDWIKCKVTCGCVTGAPREGTENKAAMRLLGALVRARVPYEFPQRPYLPGLLTSRELAGIVTAVDDELRRNSLAAEAAQKVWKAAIIELAIELGLNPRPAGHNDCAWVADCPRRSHTLMLSPSLNEFGCGYCRRKGGPAELRAFAVDVKS